MKGKKLPLTAAYPFGIKRGLEKEITEIHDKIIKWGASYTPVYTSTIVRRGYIV